MTNKTAIGILLLVWAIVELLIFPIGEFPLNDDWCYAIPVRDLINGEKLRIVNWGSMTLLTQIGWGYLFSTIFGFSFLTLRISVIVLGIIGSIHLYLLIENATKNKSIGIFFALLFLLNPLQISLSNTFMTDIPFCTFSIVSLFYIKKMYDTNFDIKYVFLVNILLISTILLRQLGLFICIGMFCSVFWMKEKKHIFYAILPLVLGIIILNIYEHWLVISGNSTNNYYNTKSLIADILGKIPQMFFQLFHRLGLSFQYIGVALLPIVLPQAYYYVKNIKYEKWKITIPFFIVFLIPIIRAISDFPYGNVLMTNALGSKVLYDIFLFKYYDTQNNAISTLVFKLLGFIGGISLLISLLKLFFSTETKIRKNEPFETVIIFSILAYFGLLVSAPAYFDRYCLPMFFLFLILFSFRINTITLLKYNAFAILYFVILTTFSILTTKDYFRWNRIKKQAFDEVLNTEKLTPEQIHAGIDYTMWLTYEHKNASTWKEKFDLGNQPYIIAFTKNISPFTVYKSYPYKRTYLPSNDTIFVLKRIN